MGKNQRLLVLGDLHFPYCHADTFAFIKAIQKKYSPDKVVSIGDEADLHSISFHDHNPNLFSPGDELGRAKDCIKLLEEIFPEMDILESNHGSLFYRKQVNAKLPREIFKDYNAIYGVSKKWKWHRDLTLKLSNGKYVYFCHGKSSDVMKTSQSMGMSTVQGHYHEKMSIQYWGNSLGLYFAAQTGCLVDDESLAMEYNKLNLRRPLIGSLIIIDGHPRLHPMVLDTNGRWNKELL